MSRTAWRAVLVAAVALVHPACHRSSGGGGPPPPTPPAITGPASPLPDGTAGSAYAPVAFTASGTPPITWSVTSGALPPGMTLDGATGVYSGTPTAAGPYSFIASLGELVVFRVFAEIPAVPTSPPLNGHGSNYLPLVLVTDGVSTLASVNRTSLRAAQGLVEVQACVELAFIAPAAGTYFLSVGDAAGTGGADRFYLADRD